MSGKLRPLSCPPFRHPSRFNPDAYAQFPRPCQFANDQSAEEVRRSGRANKGHHTKNAEALDEPLIPKPKSKSKADKKAQSHQQAQSESGRSQSGEHQQEGDDKEDIYRCVCGDQREIRGREMICCDKCSAWQHNKCLNLPDSSYWENKTYLCEQCKPEDHQELLAAIARGEKPWNRKKGSKGAKPRFRPSDVGSEAASEKKDSPTPTTQSHPPTPAPHVAPTPTTAQEAKPDPRGRSEPKVSTAAAVHCIADPLPQSTKKATPKSQPQSPLGEKRPHDAIAEKEKETASTKRRKSSAPQVNNTSPPEHSSPDVDALPKNQQLLVQNLAKIIGPVISKFADSGDYRIPDGDTPSSLALRLSLQIDRAAVKQLGAPTDHSSPYTMQFRKYIFNFKQNPVLVQRLLGGSLSPDELAVMSAEEMASEDKQREFAAMKEASERQIVLTEEAGPRLRKTHKGEEIVGEDNEAAEQEFRPPEFRQRDDVENSKAEQLSPKDEGGPVVELPEAATTAVPPLDTAVSQQQPNDSARRQSEKFDINSVLDKVRSPQHDQQTFLHRRQSSIRPPQTPHEGPVVDADIDRLLKDEDNDVEMGGYSADPSVVWKGEIEMQSVGSFEAVARFIAGGDFGQIIPWDKLLAPKLPILGRIENQRGNNYIEGLASNSNHDVSVLALTAVSPEGQTLFDRLYSYFHPRNRWGVVPVDQLPHEAMRDLYVIPVEPGGSELPPFLNLLAYCTIETPRPTPMLLLALVARLPDPTPQPAPMQQDHYPVSPAPVSQAAPEAITTNGGPNPSPLANPHGPQYSPMQAGFSPMAPFPPQNGGHNVPNPQAVHNGQYQQPGPIGYPGYNMPNGANGNNPQNGHNVQPQQPLHYRHPKALEIFGPLFGGPVLTWMLDNSPDMSEEYLFRLKHIFETYPAAREDMDIFRQILAQRSQG